VNTTSPVARITRSSRLASAGRNGSLGIDI
jgi:hypothetical protein